MQSSGKTDTGKRRRQNEDAFRIVSLDDNACLLVVCDGVGGNVGGNVASVTAIQHFCDYILHCWSDVTDSSVIPDLLCRASDDANNAVCSMAKLNPALTGMGTTLVAAILTQHKLFAANVGDSRLYLISSGSMKRLTKDHTLVQFLVDAGRLTSEEAAVSPQRNVIIRAIGSERSVDTDTFTVDFDPDDRLFVLLCSDGLTDYMSEDDIFTVVSDPLASVDEKTDALIKGANNGGGGDNITAIVAEC